MKYRKNILEIRYSFELTLEVGSRLFDDCTMFVYFYFLITVCGLVVLCTYPQKNSIVINENIKYLFKINENKKKSCLAKKKFSKVMQNYECQKFVITEIEVGKQNVIYIYNLNILIN